MNRKLLRELTIVVMALGLTGLGGCGTVSRGVAPDGSGAEQLIFPKPSDSLVPGGTFPNVEDLREVAPGMSKDQLYQMFGPPHFHEGVWDVREWDYLFNFRLHQGKREFVTCEYKILFDRKDVAQSFYWKPASCAKLLRHEQKPTRVVQKAPVSLKHLMLSADAMFGFDKWRLSDQGRQALNEFLQQIRSFGQIVGIHVTGYTDRIGSDDYNTQLSEKRANSVRDYLVDGGISQDVIQSRGRGEAEPLVECPHTTWGKLVRCLAPNRRVEVSGKAKP